MSEYKVSFNLLKQQIDELKNVATQMQSIAEKVSAASVNLGQDELLATARSSLMNTASNIGTKAELLGIASATLGEIIEEYTGTETKNITRAEGTRAHSRDFYKNPVTISDGAGEAFAAGVSVGVSAGSAATVAGAEVGATSAVAGAEIGAAAAIAGVDAGTAATVAGADAATAASSAGFEAGTSSALGGAAVGAGVAVAGAAVGAAGVVGGIKLSKAAKESRKEKAVQQKEDETFSVAPEDEISEHNNAEIREAEDALQKAKAVLDSL